MIQTDAPANGTTTAVPTTDLAELLVRVRRHLHQHPELGLQEVETGRYVRALLEKHGLTPSPIIAGTGFYVDITGDHPGPTVAYRADMDALPTQDAKSVPYRSIHTGVAHLCGHDAHTAMALGVALSLHEQRDRLRGTARILFQPNEEGTPGGATLMIPDGAIDGVKAIFAVHVDPSQPLGQFGIRAGAMTASVLTFRVFIRKEGTGHSARPHEGGDPIWVMNQMMSSLYGMVGRVDDARDAAVLTICRLRAGEALNVIPAEVEFGGTIRCTNYDTMRTLREHLLKIVEPIGSIYGMQVDVELIQGAPPVDNDPECTALVEKQVKRLFGKKALYQIPRPSMGGEDFAHYLRIIPGAFLRVGTQSSEETSFPVHDARFDLDERALLPTVRLMSEVLIAYLNEHTA